MPAIKWTAPKRRAFLTTLSITGPIVSDMHFERAFTFDQVTGEWRAPFSGRKDRDCAFVMAGVEGYALIDGAWRLVDFQFRKSNAAPDDSGGYSRPTGIQPFGVWSWGRVVDGDVDIRRASLVRLTTEHICTDALLPWQNGHVRTDIGPFPIGEN
jgi:hypothetical protein